MSFQSYLCWIIVVLVSVVLIRAIHSTNLNVDRYERAISQLQIGMDYSEVHKLFSAWPHEKCLAQEEWNGSAEHFGNTSLFPFVRDYDVHVSFNKSGKVIAAVGKQYYLGSENYYELRLRDSLATELQKSMNQPY